MSKYSTENESSIRWLPKHGEPRYAIDAVSQKLVKVAAYPPLYTAIFLLIMVVFIIWGGAV